MWKIAYVGVYQLYNFQDSTSLSLHKNSSNMATVGDDRLWMYCYTYSVWIDYKHLSVLNFKSSNVSFQKRYIWAATTKRPPQNLYAMYTFPNLWLISSGSTNNRTEAVMRKRKQVPVADNALQKVFSRDFLIPNWQIYADYWTF